MTIRGPAARAASTSGFTILETLVALTLVALLVGAVLQAIRWVSAASGLGQRAERAAEVQAGATAFTDLLAAALPPGPAGATFAGDPSAFSFDGVSDGSAMPPGRVRVTIGHQRSDAGGALVVTIRPISPVDQSEGARAWTTVLIEGVNDARFAYFGQPDGRGGPAWAPSWSSRTAQPALVRADLALTGMPTLPGLPLNARLGRGPSSPAGTARY